MDHLDHLLNRLRDVPRQGWLRRGVPEGDCESVADHSWSVALKCLLHPDEALRGQAARIAIVHDVAEIITGDITPHDGISRQQKFDREELAFKFFACVDPDRGQLMMDLWREYEGRETGASKLVHDADKLDRLGMAFKYAKQFPTRDFADFRADADSISDSHFARAAQAIISEWDMWASQDKQQSLCFIFVIGGPGVGKGSQCASAADDLPVAHISAGELLRKEQARPQSLYRNFIGDSFTKSVPVPPDLIMMLLARDIEDARSSGKTAILLDGFPRSVAQLEFFEKEICPTYETVVLEAPDDVLAQRLVRRAASSRRDDDKPDMIRRRVETFKDASKSVLDRVSQQAVHKINSDRPMEEVAGDFRQTVLDILQHDRSA